MSVYIKSMEMPTSCDECYIRERSTCPILKVNVTGWGKPLNCPLVPVPDHGRLIDADTLEIQDGWLSDDRERNVLQTHTHITFVYSNDIVNAPTIIPADESDMDSFIRIFEEDDEEDGMDSFIRILKD